MLARALFFLLSDDKEVVFLSYWQAFRMMDLLATIAVAHKLIWIVPSSCPSPSIKQVFI